MIVLFGKHGTTAPRAVDVGPNALRFPVGILKLVDDVKDFAERIKSA